MKRFSIKKNNIYKKKISKYRRISKKRRNKFSRKKKGGSNTQKLKTILSRKKTICIRKTNNKPLNIIDDDDMFKTEIKGEFGSLYEASIYKTKKKKEIFDACGNSYNHNSTSITTITIKASDSFYNSAKHTIPNNADADADAGDDADDDAGAGDDGDAGYDLGIADIIFDTVKSHPHIAIDYYMKTKIINDNDLVICTLAGNGMHAGGLFNKSYNDIIQDVNIIKGSQEEAWFIYILFLLIGDYIPNNNNNKKSKYFYNTGISQFGSIFLKIKELFDGYDCAEYYKLQMENRYKHFYWHLMAGIDGRHFNYKSDNRLLVGDMIKNNNHNYITQFILYQYELMFDFAIKMKQKNKLSGNIVCILPMYVGTGAYKNTMKHMREINAALIKKYINNSNITDKFKFIYTWANFKEIKELKKLIKDQKTQNLYDKIKLFVDNIRTKIYSKHREQINYYLENPFGKCKKGLCNYDKPDPNITFNELEFMNSLFQNDNNALKTIFSGIQQKTEHRIKSIYENFDEIISSSRLKWLKERFTGHSLLKGLFNDMKQKDYEMDYYNMLKICSSRTSYSSKYRTKVTITKTNSSSEWVGISIEIYPKEKNYSNSYILKLNQQYPNIRFADKLIIANNNYIEYKSKEYIMDLFSNTNTLELIIDRPPQDVVDKIYKQENPKKSWWQRAKTPPPIASPSRAHALPNSAPLSATPPSAAQSTILL